MASDGAPASEPPPAAEAQFKTGDKLVLAAPAFTGLPTGATAIVASTRYDTAAGCWKYDVTLTGIGGHGSGIRFVQGVNEGWLRTEGRIATAKSCAPLPFGSLLRLAPRVVVPLFQRRYCWDESQWRELWRDVAFPRTVMTPHAIGRVVVAREHGSLILVDGQQRCMTLSLLLCAVRDLAREIAERSSEVGSAARDPAPGEAAAMAPGEADARLAKSAADLVGTIDGVLLRRERRLRREGGAEAAPKAGSAAAQADVGLESLARAAQVRLIPSRDDRLPFCRLVLGEPVGSEGATSTRAERKLGACYACFRREAHQLLRRAEAGDDGARRLELLRGVATGALERISAVVFELQDGVSLQNMYDMLAQRERVINKFFQVETGQRMSEADLVRNLLLNHIADDDDRVGAYEAHWQPMERAQGDGDAAVLEAFLRRFLESARAAPAAQASDDRGEAGVEAGAAAGASSAAPRPPEASPKASPSGAALLDGFAALLAARGGNAGAADLYAAGTASAEGKDLVDADAAGAAATALLAEMRAQASAMSGQRLDAQPVPNSLPPDLWSPEEASRRAAAASAGGAASHTRRDKPLPPVPRFQGGGGPPQRSGLANGSVPVASEGGTLPAAGP